MEKIINSIYGVAIFYIIIAILSLAVSTRLKKVNSDNSKYTNPYLAYVNVTAEKSL